MHPSGCISVLRPFLKKYCSRLVMFTAPDQDLYMFYYLDLSPMSKRPQPCICERPTCCFSNDRTPRPTRRSSILSGSSADTVDFSIGEPDHSLSASRRLSML